MPPRRLTKEQDDALRQARVADAYKEVFGADSTKRTSAQAIVWADLQKVGSVKSPVFVADAKGELSPIRAAHVDGRRWVWLYVEANVETQIKIPD